MTKDRVELLEQRISHALTRHESNRYFTASSLVSRTGLSPEEIAE